MLSACIRTVSSTILCIAALSGLLRPPSESLQVPNPVSGAAPAAASVPAIAAILDATPEPAEKLVKAPAVVKSCPCGDQCTCGCQDGQPCRCGQASRKVASAPQSAAVPIRITRSGADWVQNGQPWSRESLLSHLYFDSANHGRHVPGSLDHLSLDELNAIHNGEHEQKSARTASPVVRTMPTTVRSSCPGGQCPPQRRVIFR